MSKAKIDTLTKAMREVLDYDWRPQSRLIRFWLFFKSEEYRYRRYSILKREAKHRGEKRWKRVLKEWRLMVGFSVKGDGAFSTGYVYVPLVNEEFKRR